MIRYPARSQGLSLSYPEGNTTLSKTISVPAGKAPVGAKAPDSLGFLPRSRFAPETSAGRNAVAISGGLVRACRPVGLCRGE